MERGRVTWLHIECPLCQAFIELEVSTTKDVHSGTCLRCPKGTKLVVTDWGQRGRKTA